jgi:hypothetical protein
MKEQDEKRTRKRPSFELKRISSRKEVGHQSAAVMVGCAAFVVAVLSATLTTKANVVDFLPSSAVSKLRSYYEPGCESFCWHPAKGGPGVSRQNRSCWDDISGRYGSPATASLVRSADVLQRSGAVTGFDQYLGMEM